MDRLQLISQINPTWAITISNFIQKYPEFKQYLYMAPINQIEPIPYKNVSTLFQAIMHYICSAGVRYTYAVKQWAIIYPLIHLDDWAKIKQNSILLKNNTNIQNKKREMYYNLCTFMNQHNLTHKNLNTSHLDLLKKNVPGIGDGCIAWCKKYFSFDDDTVEYTDINFKKGFLKLYNTDSLALRKQKAKDWTENRFGRIAGLMVLQIGFYAATKPL
jgi:hypothetical protein